MSVSHPVPSKIGTVVNESIVLKERLITVGARLDQIENRLSKLAPFTGIDQVEDHPTRGTVNDLLDESNKTLTNIIERLNSISDFLDDTLSD